MSPTRWTYLLRRVKYPIYLSDFNQICIFSTESLPIKFGVNPVCGSRVDTCVQADGTDRRDEANRCFSLLCERPYKARKLRGIWTDISSKHVTFYVVHTGLMHSL